MSIFEDMGNIEEYPELGEIIPDAEEKQKYSVLDWLEGNSVRPVLRCRKKEIEHLKSPLRIIRRI